nr:MAG TPA: Cytosine specific methyltransferase [Caudoviricetes sp.]
MAERGYCIEWKVYNSKDYRVPQNRERIYIIGYYGSKCARSLLPIKRENSNVASGVTTRTESSFIDLSKQKVRITNNSRCLLARYTSCITNQAAVNSGVISVRAILTPDRLNKRQNGRRLKKEGDPAFTLTSQDRHGVLIKNATKQGYSMAQVGDGIDLAYPDSETRRGRVQHQRCNTLTTSDNLGVLVDDEPIRIRKLTPKECWRLQGFSDAQYEKAAAVNSNSQLYKQAGNAVTVNIVEEIGRHIMGVVNEEACKGK